MFIGRFWYTCKSKINTIQGKIHEKNNLNFNDIGYNFINDGMTEALVENYEAASKETMYDLANAWVDIIDRIVNIMDVEASVSDFGIPPQIHYSIY